ncbi:hypothetical protein ZWY2020_003731 [Hordeum vulgare]|nr:hypothetical protein ZWY2020_003731 [Hordeum vulgare]
MVIGAGTSTTQGKASANAADPAAVTADTLQAALTGLKTPIAASTNPNDARASLEEDRRHILEEGIDVASAKRRMEATQREYNSAYGLNPVSEAPSRLGSVRGRGRFIAEILCGKQPVYETPAANLRAAQAAMEEMPSFEGEERSFQEKRVKDLLDAANEQQTRLDRDQAQSESPGPNPGARRNPSGHHHAEGSSSHRTSDRKGEGSKQRSAPEQLASRRPRGRATRCMRFSSGGPMPPLAVPFRWPCRIAFLAIRDAQRLNAPGDHPSRRTAPSVRPASAPGSEGSRFPEASPCLGILPSTTTPPSQRTG